MNLPKRHHFVSEMQQRRFTNEDGKLYFFDKRFPEKGVLATKPKNLFVEGHLYTRTDERGNKDVSLERYFAALEGDADRIIEKMVLAVRNNNLPCLTVDEKNLWDLFFCYQWKRVPEAIEAGYDVRSFDLYLKEVIEEFEENHRPLSPEEHQHFANKKTRAQLFQNSKVMAIADPGGEVQNVLGKKGLIFAVTYKSNKSFVIGSRPVIRLSSPGREHLSDPSVEIWLPIASDVAVTPALSRGQERFVEIKDEDVRKINACIYQQSNKIAGCSERLIRSLTHPR